MNYYAFHIGDYKSHTSHLSLIEDLAYRRMLDVYYLTESPLPDVKKIARAICMRENIEDIQTVLDEFFIDTEEGFIHERCEREIKAMNDKSGKAKLSALKRWSKSDNANAMPESCERNANASNNHANASKNDANAMRDGCEGNAPNPNPNPIPKPNNTVGDFDVFWESYPDKKAKQAATKAWSKLKPNESLFNLIIDALEKQKPYFKVGFIPHPATWLNGRRWEDAIPTQTEGQEAKPTNQPKTYQQRQDEEYDNNPSFIPFEWNPSMGTRVSELGKITEEEKERRRKISRAAIEAAKEMSNGKQ